MTLTRLLVLAPLVGCTSQSPLVESSPQIELVTNPGKVAGTAPLELTLTTWNHLAALGDAVDADQIHATLDGAPLAIAPSDTGYFGNGDRYVAAFVMPAAHAEVATGPTSMLTITDSETTWSVRVGDVMTNDLHPASAMTAGQANTVIWPSAATGDQPYSTIDWACIQVGTHGTACYRSEGTSDPGISVAQQLLTIDVPAQPGDTFTVWGARRFSATSAGDGNDVLTTVLDQVTGTFQ
ncbi:MAG TPA: hypothetical protein VFS15_22915 [Kofleriaceae bacterium]|nr:hypothetical protein [Kofleriaceae bacterium]